MAKNKRCPLQDECGKKCEYEHNELDCLYYANNGIGDNTIPDQEERRAALSQKYEDALLDDELKDIEDDHGGIVWIDIDHLNPHPNNPRKDLGDLSELADSIKAKGVLQNLTVVPYFSQIHKRVIDGQYTVIIGHRRTEAARIAGLTRLPCIITDMTEAEQVQTMLLENMQRSDLTYYEQAQGFQMMLDLGDSVDSISDKTGFSQTTVRKRLKMAELDPEKLKKACEKQITLEALERVSKVEDINARNKILDAMGTSNFEFELGRALRTQETEKKQRVWREELTKRGLKEIKSSEIWSDKYKSPSGHSYINLTADISMYDFESVQYFAFDNYGTIYLRCDKPPISVEEEKAEEEERRKEEEIDAREEKLAEEFTLLYKLRAGFIHKMSETEAKGKLNCISEFIYKNLITANNDWLIFFPAALFETFSAKVPENRKTADYKTIIEGKPYKALLAAAWAISGDNEEIECIGWNASYRKNVHLESTYDFLIELGYEMSDEEKKLVYGTSELYMKDDEDDDEENEDDDFDDEAESEEDVVEQLVEMYEDRSND